MKNWIKFNLSIKKLLIAFLIFGVGFVVVESTKKRVPLSYYPVQIEAAKIMSESLGFIREEREARGIPVDEKLDPNKTGIIGEDYSQLTTTLGNLSAKRTSTNPDFSALMVKYFYQAELKKDDVIAIGSSGSFPGLIIAALSACKAMKIEPLIIYAIGASEYGATIPNFTFIEMLEILNQKDILPYQLLAVSMGGNNDQAEDMFYPNSQEVIRRIAEKSDVFFIDEGKLADSIQKRMEIYKKAADERQIKLFVNIGGASANFGNTAASITYPNGLVIHSSTIPVNPERGLIFEFQELGLPIIHLLNIRDLALSHGISIDPVPFPEIGQSMVYWEVKYRQWIIILSIFTGIFYLILARSNEMKGI